MGVAHLGFTDAEGSVPVVPLILYANGKGWGHAIAMGQGLWNALITTCTDNAPGILKTPCSL